MTKLNRKSDTIRQFVCAATALALCAGLSACSSSSDAPKSASDTMNGISAKGKPGSKPEISFDTPLKVENQSHQVIQKGDGDVIQDGDRVCTRSVAIDSKTGKEINSTWDEEKPECSIVIDKTSIPAYYDVFRGQKINTTIAIGIDDQQEGGQSGSSKDSQGSSYIMALFRGQKINTTIAIGIDDQQEGGQSGSSKDSQGSSYIMALTFVSKTKDLKRAEGEKVKDVPADLPKISLSNTGKPSLDLNNYKPTNTLVSQTLIKGKGAKVGEHQTISANYTGWLASDGKQFDSSWDRGQASDFSLDQVVKGWQQGLAGQTVGSQVLVIVPPDLGYGDQEKSGIPANSTLIFVVDILAAY
ncbi:Peptidyl-prolyl cis-trans isomerase [Bifidobacterium coryneforme]|uniref:peptidylprolyl isomerase n=1 Tax=Bifidobacterium coryneforme TaxID=1687 RepID=A0ABD4ABT8_9BIFI|nr:FKBP-type peptidyl-prolyl cis-trans isomerase [Bifidobacterium coryneforme]KJY52766.1 Peptidyl-prolyl cis-trans isomerase [Bifidobacterium coryneforme]